MQDLQIELNKYRSDLNKAITAIRERVKNRAIAERDYRVELAKEILRLRTEGIPITIISDLCRGNENIADLKVKRDIAETLHESNMQFIYKTKLNIDIVMKQIEAERKGV
ncbi:hypothetical protein RBU61_07590 [Tissierella sp. MB52-C2]|uniref:hypothetical protein n=1 Tax=Tissierella sp. MB52-C2 TaxID=3070999 RepID=UPI00280A6261|nr:hypothetical protein [Tissierella sp. MB52-C2]WMM26526.1 hypothetical protein RBU61_07590 [Tissierella sp. MB52-C2]